MKKVIILLSGVFMIMNLLQCSSSQKTDPKVLACKTGCETTAENCIKKAVKNEAKKAACEAVKTRCNSDCEKK